jgi:hypothetical protein
MNLTPWGLLNSIIGYLKQVLANQQTSQSSLNGLLMMQGGTANEIAELSARVTTLQQQTAASQQAILTDLHAIYELLIPPPVAGVVITFQNGEEEDMAVTRAALDITIPDDGSGNAKAVLSFIDKAGLPTATVSGASVATVATMSNPAIVATVDATGLNITMAPATPPVLATGVTLSVSVTITNPDNTVLGPFTATGDTALDVVTSAIGGVQVVES